MAEAEDCGLSERDLLLQNHKREKRELQARIQELKNSIPKGDKHRKKEATLEVSRLEQELTKRHCNELSQLDSTLDGQKSQATGSEETSSLADQLSNGLQLADNNSKSRVSKAQKRRDKKAAAATERETRIAEQEIQNLQGDRHLEEVSIKSLLHQRGLDIYQIPADGNCLYQAVIHQLTVHEEKKPNCSNVSELRHLTADQMRKDQDNYLPFLTNCQTGEPLTSEEFEAYCADLEGTNVWGGQIEIRAISEALHVPIEVIQSSGPSISLGDEFGSEKKPIILSYHRHAYGLGEHYNSVVAKSSDEKEEKFVIS